MTIALPTPASMRPLSRNTVAVAAVLLLHGAALWALQRGLVQRTVETVVPVALVSELLVPPAPPTVAPPAPQPPAPATPAPAPTPPPKPQPVRHAARKPAPPRPPAPRPVAAPDTMPAPQAPTGAAEPQPAPSPAAAPVAPVAAPASPTPAPAAPPATAPAPAKVELPTKDADYLHNPPPAYPPLSYRLGEEGRVLLHVLIGPDGRAQDAQVLQSSGYPRLDNAALKAALGWRYVPGRRGGVAEAMWVNVPVQWELKN